MVLFSWILVIGFGVCQMCRGIEWSLMIQREQYTHKVCPDVITSKVSTFGVSHCCVLCDQLEYCHSVFYVPGQVSYCYLVNVMFFSTSGCVLDMTAEHYIARREPYCHPDDELYRTVLLSDGLFTYKVVHSNVKGSIAAEYCKASGGFLAKLSTVPRMEMITGLMRNCTGFGQTSYYVGGSNANATDYLADDAWKWHDGEPINMNSTFWATNRPNIASRDHCLIIEGIQGWKFNDEYCLHTIKYICEKDGTV